MVGALLWLYSPTWDAVKPKLKVGFFCALVVIDPTDLGATIVGAQVLCLTIFTLSPSISDAEYLPFYRWQ